MPGLPEDLLTETSFTLTSTKAEYLADKITQNVPQSPLASLILEQIPLTEVLWDDPMFSELSSRHQNQVDHTMRFSFLPFGAPFLYNLMLAELTGETELESSYRESLVFWQEDLGTAGALVNWDRDEFWRTVFLTRPRLPVPTRQFADAWYELVASGKPVAEQDRARRLLREREVRPKGKRARLTNQAARDNWSGVSGTMPLTFRWEIARSHVQDLTAALGDPVQTSWGRGSRVAYS